jgi:protein involved in temperature-dependent protein secretion
MSDPNVATLLRDGKLADAIAAVQAALRKSPTNLDARVLLAELLVIAGNLERADVILKRHDGSCFSMAARLNSLQAPRLRNACNSRRSWRCEAAI